MGIFEDGIVFDHTINQAYYYFRGENRLGEITTLLKKPIVPEEQFTCTQPIVNTSKKDFEKAVEKAKHAVLQAALCIDGAVLRCADRPHRLATAPGNEKFRTAALEENSLFRVYPGSTIGQQRGHP